MTNIAATRIYSCVAFLEFVKCHAQIHFLANSVVTTRVYGEHQAVVRLSMMDVEPHSEYSSSTLSW